MSAIWDFSRLLDEGYCQEIKVKDIDKKRLASARDTIRQHLRASFATLRIADNQNALLIEKTRTALAGQRAFLAPKFHMQGSFVYNTHTDAIQHPPQEIDMDDGMFLPVRFFMQDSETPVVDCNLYIDNVKTSLEKLATKKTGWWVEEKACCLRMHINKRLHVDIPLYAIRDEKYDGLVEALNKAFSTFSLDSLREQVELDRNIYTDLNTEDMRLATRDGWIKSDPRKLEEWFKGKIRVHGEALRTITRVFKGYRDYIWTDSSLSSICIMAAVVKAYDENPEFSSLRLGAAIESVSNALVQILASPIENPVYPGDQKTCLCNGWSSTERQSIRKAFQNLGDAIDRAATVSDPAYALQRIRGEFGDRMSNDVALLELTTEGIAAYEAAAAQNTPPPVVTSHTSG